MNSKSIIPISALVTFGTMSLANIQNNGRLPGTREWLGFVVVYGMLSIGSDLGLPFAGGFALLVMITVLLTRGLEALEFITGKVQPLPKGGRGKGTVPPVMRPNNKLQKA